MLNRITNRRLLRRGEPARARVVEMIDHAHGSRASRVRMTLEINPPGGTRYEVRDRWRVSGSEPVGRGSELCVVVDPEHRHRIAIDWARTHDEVRDEIAKRRKLMSVGTPVPVSKIRAEAEQIGYEPWAGGSESGERPASERLLNIAPASEEPREHGGEREDLLARLDRLRRLRADGSLTDGEFQAVKRHVLAKA